MQPTDERENCDYSIQLISRSYIYKQHVGFYRFEIYDCALVFLVSLLSIFLFSFSFCVSFFFPGLAKILQHYLLLVLFFCFFSLWNWCNQQFIAQWMKFNLNWLSMRVHTYMCAPDLLLRQVVQDILWIFFFFSLPLLHRRESPVTAAAFFIIPLWYWLLAQPGNKCYETFSCLSCVAQVRILFMYSALNIRGP